MIFEVNGIEHRDIREIMKVIGSYRNDIVTRKTSLIDEVMRPIYKMFFAYLPASLRKYSSWARSGKELDYATALFKVLMSSSKLGGLVKISST